MIQSHDFSNHTLYSLSALPSMYTSGSLGSNTPEYMNTFPKKMVGCMILKAMFPPVPSVVKVCVCAPLLSIVRPIGRDQTSISPPEASVFITVSVPFAVTRPFPP